MAENHTSRVAIPIHWWGLLLGVIAIPIGIWASFEYLSQTSTVVLWLFGILAYAALLGGVFGLGRFILDFILRGINSVDTEANR